MSKRKKELTSQTLLGVSVSTLNLEDTMNIIVDWARLRSSKVVCSANIYLLMEAYWNKDFLDTLNLADLVIGDGLIVPILRYLILPILRLFGVKTQDHIDEINLFQDLCDVASQSNISVFFLGSHQALLDKMKLKLSKEFPNLKIAGMEPLPFRPLSESEDEALIDKLNESKAGLIFVSLGTYRQEKWMTLHKEKIKSVMIGVGGSFLSNAEIVPRAPRLLRQFGLEWFYRLIFNPASIFQRYSKIVPPFLYLAFREIIFETTNENSQNARSTKNSFINFLPEEYIGELEAQQRRWREQKLSKREIKFRTYGSCLDMTIGYLICKVEDFWLDKNKPE